METAIRNVFKGGKTDRKPYQSYGLTNPYKTIGQ
jgi:hypothetical protein